ncbi:hypothetical protein [Bradyrhizobium sp. ORS 111]|uniref:hypothetical protein n=1 Tax=Bradyrhizobium sp. ORS 111 TaxID=1685958 RepID=UPI00388D3C7D
MSHFFDMDVGPLVALAALLCALSVHVSVKCTQLRHRRIQLNVANDLLKQHSAALRKFVEDPEAPTKTKERLLIYSRVISDEDKFLDVLSQVDVKRSNDPEAKGYQKDLAQLRVMNPELAETFAVAVSSGLAASFLRYPDASEIMEATIAKVYATPRKEGAVFAGAIRKDRSEHNGNGGMTPVPA